MSGTAPARGAPVTEGRGPAAPTSTKPPVPIEGLAIHGDREQQHPREARETMGATATPCAKDHDPSKASSSSPASIGPLLEPEGPRGAVAGGGPEGGMEARERIRRFISETFFVDGFADDESFLGSGIVDSLGMMQLIAFLERDLDVMVEDAELVPENLDSVANLVAFVERKRPGIQAA